MNQIPLPFGGFERYDFASYEPAGNQVVVAGLELAAAGARPGNIYVWGRPGTGKSHLLQAVCTAAADGHRRAAYIPLKLAPELAPVMLQGLEHMDLICVDDLDRIAADSAWEQALFHLFNRMRDKRGNMVFASAQSPQAIDIALPDLKSRLAWDLGYHLRPLDQDSLEQALRQRARARMFDIPDDVMQFIANRVSRDSHSLFTLLDKLDSATLAAKKKLTVPLVRELLERERNKKAG